MGDTSELEDEVRKKLSIKEEDDVHIINPDELPDLSSDDDEATPIQVAQAAAPELTDEEILDKAAEYFWGETFSNQFEEFMTNKCDVFTDEEESKLEYTAIYQEYQELFDKCMTGYLESINVSGERFYAICQKVMNSTDEEDEQTKSLVNTMVTVADYDVFLQEMRRMGREKRGEEED
uniref:Cilia- and flagella-associated protein 36 n=1 Tax=Pyramimonas obovata TaxID=1411642 RepID=A0A6T7UI79_9CHLO|mmetsp:Transcript_12638/g.26665  ORF Transcript_12638/g.26665 Transcript_12638/m.26665 type:complete len:178 (+) Transcript_12638:63-596(+)|eukprot:CAMPEP_0118923028 /NCGR_PEP_ID=MMETSP1169-20130426/1713_1 /TAXON_ID=36882 /ORGANISM="Pyramimonas obovata, Strain CCMP722" /LENGTH=177 /DNA_ID=CAMNT_0006863961 /DNA_START=54 /DNA_END=590 /DNA_ORIENTATION=+